MKVMGLKGVGQHTPKIRVLNSQQELTEVAFWNFRSGFGTEYSSL